MQKDDYATSQYGIIDKLPAKSFLLNLNILLSVLFPHILTLVQFKLLTAVMITCIIFWHLPSCTPVELAEATVEVIYSFFRDEEQITNCCRSFAWSTLRP
jgi:hypothetical protein